MLSRDSNGGLDLDGVSPVSTGVDAGTWSKDLYSDRSSLIRGDEILTHGDLSTVERRGGSINVRSNSDCGLTVLAAGNSTGNCAVWCCHFEPPTAVRPGRAGRLPWYWSRRRRRHRPQRRLQPERPRQSRRVPPPRRHPRPHPAQCQPRTA